MDPYTEEFLRPLVTGWSGKLENARRDRKQWAETARECRRFYAGNANWMWSDEHRGKWWGNGPIPNFRMTVNKAFEYVALYLPFLWNAVPHRTVSPKAQLDMPMQIAQHMMQQQMKPLQEQLQQIQQMAQQMQGPQQQGPQQQGPQQQQGPPQLPPQLQQQAMMIQQQMQQMQKQMEQQQQAAMMEAMSDAARAELMQTWLNYTPLEQPGGGLEQHGELAVVDALLTGRGTLWPAPYNMPGSDRTLTGCFWRPSTDMLVDPDYPNINDAMWISRETTEATWKAERKFGLPPGSLKDKGTIESAWSLGERVGDETSVSRRASGQTNDLITYHEIWSKCGPGARMSGMDMPYRDFLEETCGDYCYLVISEGVPYPLNAPTEMFRNPMGDPVTEIKEAFSWPVKYFADGRFPVCVLDFYHDTESTWPVPPMGPGIGELRFLNTMVSFLSGRIVSSSRDFWVVLKSAVDDLRQYIENEGDQCIIPLNNVHGGIDNVVKILQQPQTNMDVWRIIDAVSQMLNMRWGLNELMYGQNPGGTQPRSAMEIQQKQQAISNRPQYMAKKVEAFMSDCEVLEAFCTRFYVKAKDVQPLIGNMGASLWQQLVESEDPERVMRQMSYKVAAGTARRPNKDRDVANINTFLQTFGPVMQSYFQGTGDVGPMNGAMELWGKAADMETRRLQLSPPPPPKPDPAEQQRAQAEQQKMQMEMAKSQMELQGKQLDMQSKQAETAMDMQSKQAELAMKAKEAQIAARAKMAELQMKGRQSVLDLQQDKAEHVQEMIQDQEQHVQELEQMAEKSKAQIALMKAQAAAKPKTNGTPK